jgi:hypothetical protein
MSNYYDITVVVDKINSPNAYLRLLTLKTRTDVGNVKTNIITNQPSPPLFRIINVVLTDTSQL